MSQGTTLNPAIDASVEVETITFDFGLLMNFGETITDITSVSCSVVGNPHQDLNASLRLVGVANIVDALAVPTGSGALQGAVTQRVGNMVAGVTYLLQCVVQTSGGQTLSLWADLPCISPS